MQPVTIFKHVREGENLIGILPYLLNLLKTIKMNIKTAYNTMRQKDFVTWALNNKYPYFIVIEGNREHGWVYPKKGNKQYKFDYKLNPTKTTNNEQR